MGATGMSSGSVHEAKGGELGRACSGLMLAQGGNGDCTVPGSPSMPGSGTHWKLAVTCMGNVSHQSCSANA